LGDGEDVLLELGLVLENVESDVDVLELGLVDEVLGVVVEAVLDSDVVLEPKVEPLVLDGVVLVLP